MPVRSQGKLLAGFAILCSISLIDNGCQTSSPPRSAPPRGRSASPSYPAGQVRYSSPPTPIASTPPAASQTAVPPQQAYRPTGGEQQVIAASAWQPVQAMAPPQRMPVGGPDLDSSPTLTTPRVVPMPAENGLPPTVQPSEAPAQPYFPNQPSAGTAQPFTTAQGRGTKKHGRTQFASLERSNQKDPPTGPEGKDDKDTLSMPRKEYKIPTQPPVAANNDPRPQVPYNVAGYTAPTDIPREFQKQALPPYVVEPPDILIIQATGAVTLPTQPLEGYFLVRPDGTIGLGIYGSIQVAGKTLEQVKQMVAVSLQSRVEKLSVAQIMSELQVDVQAYNSKYYYVITSGAGWGMQVFPFLSTGNETVLDAIAKINGLPPVASPKRIWLARASLDPAHPKIYPVDWCAITKGGIGLTNYQVFPGDRIFVASDPWVHADSIISKRLSPILRLFGATLLGASTVNVIKNGGTSGLGTGLGTGIR